MEVLINHIFSLIDSTNKIKSYQKLYTDLILFNSKILIFSNNSYHSFSREAVAL